MSRIPPRSPYVTAAAVGAAVLLLTLTLLLGTYVVAHVVLGALDTWRTT